MEVDLSMSGYFNPATNDFEALQGKGGASKVIVTDYLTQAPLVGAVNITAVQVELKVGSLILEGRRQLIVFPPTAGKIYWGPTGVSSSNGAPLATGDAPVIFDFDDTIAIHIYAVNDGTEREVRVVECK